MRNTWSGAASSADPEQQLTTTERSAEVWYSTAQRFPSPAGPSTAGADAKSPTAFRASCPPDASRESRDMCHAWPSRATYPLKSSTARSVAADTAPEP